MYIRFGLGRAFNPVHPVWLEYLRGLRQAQERGMWTHTFYLQQQGQMAGRESTPSSGCFSYTSLEGGKIRLHFHNTEPPEHSPLGKDRMNLRLAELKALCADIKKNIEAPGSLIGASWLYNIEAYRRLFPSAYLATARVGGNDFPFLTLWGQFVDHRGQVKADLRDRFLKNLSQLAGPEGLAGCFPFQVLHLEHSLPEFYRFYGVE